MRTFLYPLGKKTWDGSCWGFVLMAALFCALTAYLALQLDGSSLLLLFIPDFFAAFLLGAAFVATDQGLGKMKTFLLAFN